MIKQDFHLHSNFSDGKNSIEEMTRLAIRLGLKQIAFTDHVRKETKWLNNYIAEIGRVQKRHPEIIINSGIEAKIIDLDGNLDARKDFFKKVDLVLAAFHRIPKGRENYLSKEEILTNKKLALSFFYRAMMKVLENKNVDIIAHPTAILKLYKIRTPYLMKKKIARQANKFNKIFEINKKFKVPDRDFIKTLKKHKIKLIYGSDSHSVNEFRKTCLLK